MSTKRDILNWNDKLFSVSSDEIMTFANWASSSSYSTEEKANGKGMAKTQLVAPGIGTITFTIMLRQSLGHDVKAEYDWWRTQCNKGTASYMFLGAHQYGEYKWLLTKVDQINLITFKDGSWKSCDLTITFEEFFVKVKQTKLQKKATKLAKQLEKAISKAISAKNEKAREKAAKQAAKLQKQYEDAQVAAAKEAAELYKAQVEAEKAVEEAMKRYYDEEKEKAGG